MYAKFERQMDAALEFYGRQDFGTVLQICEQILNEHPDSADALYLKGLAHSRLNNAKLGIQFLKQAIVLKPEIEAFDFQRDLLVQQGRANSLEHWEQRFVLYRQYKHIDAFVVSYPKCGRTWLRLLLGAYVLGAGQRGDPLEVFSLTMRDPNFSTLEMTHDEYPHWKPADKSFPNKAAYKGKKVIFLVRDPRDVMVSYYFQYTKREDCKFANDATFRGDLSAFIRHNIGGLDSLIAFYNAWAEARDVPAGFLLLTYEDMIADTRKSLLDTVTFLDWPQRPADHIEDFVAYGGFDNMRKLEQTDALQNHRLIAPDSGDPESFKVRRGKVSGYVDYLSADDIGFMDREIDTRLNDLFARYKSSASRT